MLNLDEFLEKCPTRTESITKISGESDEEPCVDHGEILLEDNPSRYCLFPIRFPDIWKAYKNHKNAFWTSEEIDFVADKNDWNHRLNTEERYFIEHILAFFAGSDGIVLENLVQNFCREVTIPEARCFYGFQAMMENVHCVTGSTPILTDRGYIQISKLENQQVNVWNGHEFSSVHVLFTGHQSIYRVILTNGMTLDCSPGHKWWVTRKNGHYEKVETVHLKVKDTLMPFSTCVLDPPDGDSFKNPHLHGFYCMEGNHLVDEPTIDLYGKYKKYIDIFPNDMEETIGYGIRLHIHNHINRQKYFVPVNYSKRTKTEWLAGVLDARGKKNENGVVMIYEWNKPFLKSVQLLLSTLNIFSCLRKGMLHYPDDMEDFHYDCHILVIHPDALRGIGCCPKIFQLPECKVPEDRTIHIHKIIKLSECEPTYCFEEPKRHTAIFNGILTGQSETYSLMIDTFIVDPDRKQQLFEAIEHIPCITKKAHWALCWINKENNSFARRLFAFGIVEGLFFSGSFCAIFWLKERGLMTRSLGKSNEWIARDEGLHTDFAVLLYQYVKNKIPAEDAHRIMHEAVLIEEEFICESLPVRLVGMNNDLMRDYIRFVADRLLTQFGYQKMYFKSNPFPFMEKISLDGKTNFFEQRVSEYTHASTQGGSDTIFNIGDLESENF